MHRFGVASTVWREDDKPRVVWITLFALSDRAGYVGGSVPGLADLARAFVNKYRQFLDKPDRRYMYHWTLVERTPPSYYTLLCIDM